MKKYLLALTAFLFLTPITFAQTPPKTIVLQDGSIIKGNITKMENGVYTVVSDRLGTIVVKDSDIASIQTPGSQNPSPTQQIGMQPMMNGNLQSQIQAMQGSILSDPEMMKEMMKLMEDPQVQSLLADQSFINDITSMDPAKLQNNSKVQQLMNNQNVQTLMEKIQNRFNTESSPAASH